MSAPETLIIQKLRIFVTASNIKNHLILKRAFLDLLVPSKTPLQYSPHQIGSKSKQARHPDICVNGTLMAFPFDAAPPTSALVNILQSGGYVATYEVKRFDPVDMTIRIFTLMSTYDVRYLQSEQRNKRELTIHWVPIIPLNSEKIETFSMIPWRDAPPPPPK